MTTTFFVKVGDKTVGPLDSGKLRRLAAEGRLSPDALISYDGATRWVNAGTVKGLFPSQDAVSKTRVSTANKSIATANSGSPNLRPCPDCGESVSIKAPACPRCGCPLDNVSQKTSKRGMLAVVTMTAVVVAAIAGGTVGYVFVSGNWAERTRHADFITAIEAAEKAGVQRPDHHSLGEARQLAAFDAELARVSELETAIAAALPVVEFVEAYNQKDVTEMLKHVNSKLERGMKWADWIVQNTVPYASTVAVHSPKLALRDFGGWVMQGAWRLSSSRTMFAKGGLALIS